LSGLGGDEIFAGYSHFGLFEGVKTNSPSLFDRSLGKLYFLYPWLSFVKNGYLKSCSPKERLSTIRRMLMDNEIVKGTTLSLSKSFRKGHVLNQINNMGICDTVDIYQASIYECTGYLLNTLLRDADALSMGNGLEVRPVLLDHHIVEFALALPSSSKWRNGVSKSVLKDAATDLLPHNFFLRKKTGFSLPTTRWLNNNMKERLKFTLLSKDSEQYFTRRFLNNLIKNADNPRRNKYLMMIYVFLEWSKVNNLQLLRD